MTLEARTGWEKSHPTPTEARQRLSVGQLGSADCGSGRSVQNANWRLVRRKTSVLKKPGSIRHLVHIDRVVGCHHGIDYRPLVGRRRMELPLLIRERSKRLGFMEIERQEEDPQTGVQQLNGQTYEGRLPKVKKATLRRGKDKNCPREDRPREYPLGSISRSRLSNSTGTNLAPHLQTRHHRLEFWAKTTTQ